MNVNDAHVYQMILSHSPSISRVYLRLVGSSTLCREKSCNTILEPDISNKDRTLKALQQTYNTNKDALIPSKHYIEYGVI